MARILVLLAIAGAAAVTAEPKPAEAFHFAIIGDNTGRAVPGVYEAVWRAAIQAHPDFVITVGDAIEGMNDRQARAEWEAVKRVWPKNIPVYHTPGNHDVWSDDSRNVFVEETGRKPFYSFDFRNAHVVVLDNSRTEGLAPDQLAFLRSNLEQSRGEGPIFVFFHRNFWLLPLKLQVRSFPLLDLAKEYGVCCIVSGHGHQFQAIASGGVEFLEVGSSGASVGDSTKTGVGYAEGWFYQYVWVTVEGSSVHFEVRELGPPLGQGRVQTIQTTAGR